MACSKIEDYTDDPLEIELLAIFCRLQICLPLGIYCLRVESDSLLAIEAVIKEEDSCMEYSNIIWAINIL